MQFSGKRGIAIFVLIISGGVLIGFGSGVMVGRQFPAHSFQRFGDTRYLLDPSTGKVCDPFKDPTVSTNPIDQAFGASAPGYPPPCGK
jgi:hypothetical protein